MSNKCLMIGDWVENTFCLMYEKVVEIGKGLVELSCNGITENFDIKPIPLTKEILEKNGLSLSREHIGECNDNSTGTFKEDEDFLLELSLCRDDKIRWTVNGHEYELITLNYVHELQHAIRLCGIKKNIVVL